MPAILRNFVYQTDASLSLLGLCGSYGQVGVRTTRSPPCTILGSRRLANIIGCRTDRPSGPPPIRSIMSSVISHILSNIFGVFGLVAAAGNSW